MNANTIPSMQARCLIKRIQLVNRYDHHDASQFVNLGECWINESDDIDERHKRLREALYPGGWSMHFYFKDADDGYKYTIIVY